MSGPVFERIYASVCRIPEGKVATYKMVAAASGNPRWARVVGYALHNNPAPGIIPCHRVVNHLGKVAPGFAFGGMGRQRELLESEGVKFIDEQTVDLNNFLCDIKTLCPD